MNAGPERDLYLDEYFLLEEAGKGKHDYYHGAIYAMTSASLRHNLITIKCLQQFSYATAGKICTVFPGDLRLKSVRAGWWVEDEYVGIDRDVVIALPG